MTKFLITDENGFVEIKSLADDKLMVFDDSVTVVIPSTPQADVISGASSILFDGLAAYLTGVAVLPNEQYFYIGEQFSHHFKIYNHDKTFYGLSDDIPGYTYTTGAPDSKVWIPKSYNAIYYCVDTKTIAKFSLTGEYINHYTSNITNNSLVSITEAANGDIYVGARYGRGITVLDSDLSLKQVITYAGDVAGLTIQNNVMYVADYDAGFENPAVYSMNLDGTNKQKLTVFDTLPNFSPFDVQASSDGLYLYVTAYDNDVNENRHIFKYEIATNSIITGFVTGIKRITSVWVNPWGTSLYATTFNENKIIKII